MKTVLHIPSISSLFTPAYPVNTLFSLVADPNLDAASAFWRVFSCSSTLAYHAPPARVRVMPKTLVGLSVRLKMMTARMMVRTCLTLAVRSQERQLGYPTPQEEKRTRYSHSESARLLVRRKAHDVEPKRDHSIHEERRRLPLRHLGGAVDPHALEFARVPRADDALHEREWTHPDEEVEWVELEAADLDSVRHLRTRQLQLLATKYGGRTHDRLECRKERAKESEDKAPGGKVVIAVRRKEDADHDGAEGEVGRSRVALVEEDDGEDDGEEGGHRADL